MKPSPEQRAQYRDSGYFILERAVDASTLEMLREACQVSSEIPKTIDVHGINNPERTFSESGFYQRSRPLREFLFGEWMQAMCAATIGDAAYLFNEFFVIKQPGSRSGFRWHQDSGYVGYPHPPYATFWIALDDMTADNGTVSVLPYQRAGTRELVEHRIVDDSNDRVGFWGDDPGEAALVPAGSVVAFSSTTFHRSAPNRTTGPRRAYIAQFSPEPILEQEGSAPLNLAVPFVRNGRRTP